MFYTYVSEKCEDILNTFQNTATILYEEDKDIVNDNNEIIEVQKGM